MILGYARVSTDSQNLDRQIDALRSYKVDEILTEKMTGTKAHRPELNRLLDKVRKGDTVVVESLSRLGRSTKDLLNDAEIDDCISGFVKYLNERGIKIDIKIEHCGESTKNRFQRFLYDEKRVLLDNDEFVEEVNYYLGEISNYINTQNYKFIFIGKQLRTKNLWGEANDWVAVIAYLKEKVIWHEIAHLLGAHEHYDPETLEGANICSNPSHCIMTFGKTVGDLCSESLQEIREYLNCATLT